MATKTKAVKKFAKLKLTDAMQSTLVEITHAVSGVAEYTAKTKFALQCIALAESEGIPMHADQAVTAYGESGKDWSVFARTRGGVTENFSAWAVDKMNTATGQKIGHQMIAKSLRPVFFPIVFESECKSGGDPTKRVFDSCKRVSADDNTKFVDQLVDSVLTHTRQTYFVARQGAKTTGIKGTPWRYTVNVDKALADIANGTLVITRDDLVLNKVVTKEKAHADKFNPKNFKKAECAQAIKDIAEAITAMQEKLELLKKYKGQLTDKKNGRAKVTKITPKKTGTNG